MILRRVYIAAVIKEGGPSRSHRLISLPAYSEVPPYYHDLYLISEIRKYKRKVRKKKEMGYGCLTYMLGGE